MSFVIKPWPFKKNEKVELYWLCSPYFNKDNGWNMKLVFKREDNTIVEIHKPWGMIPLLRLGQKFIDGAPIEVGKRGNVFEIIIPNRDSFEICMAYDIPSYLYYFFKVTEYGHQKICKFKIGDRNFFVPCLEIVRTFLTPHKTLANCIMKPGGIDLLIEKTEIHGKHLDIDLSDEVPCKLVRDETAEFIAWLKYETYANKAWNSVYSKVFMKAISNSPFNPVSEMQNGVFIEVLPPIYKDSKWTCRGIVSGNDVLILEVISKTNLFIPFESIYYTHNSLKNSEEINEPKTRRSTKPNKKEDRDEKMDDSCEPAKKDSGQSIIEQMSIGFGFNRNPQIKKVRKNSQKVRTADSENYKRIQGNGNGEHGDTITAQDWVYGGKIRPIEFRTLEIVRHNITKGLEDFLKAIDYIDKNFEEISMSLNTIYLPTRKSFSTYPDGYRRNCAIVKVEREKQLPCYILEVGRADDWSISTLLIYQLVGSITLDNMEGLLYKLLVELIENNGHWDKQLFDSEVIYGFDLLKHVTGQGTVKWSTRILNKI